MILWSLFLLAIVCVGVIVWCLPKSSITNPVPLGRVGVAVQTFAKEGFVLVRGELWRAHNRAGVIAKGDAVVVVGYGSGLSVEVVRKE